MNTITESDLIERAESAALNIFVTISDDRTVWVGWSRKDGLGEASELIANCFYQFANSLLKFKPEFQSMTIQDVNEFIAKENEKDPMTTLCDEPVTTKGVEQ